MPPTSLRQRAIAPDQLMAAWRRILSKPGDRPSEKVQRFVDDGKLDILASELAAGTYEPVSLTLFDVPKKDGTTRELNVPALRDRIAERAILDVVSPYVDPHLGPASYAYREGLGVVDAVAAVVGLRDEGLHWVLHADIDDCFNTIPRDTAVRRLKALLPDDSLDPLIDLLTHRLVATRRGLKETRGVPQGTALSPMLANLILVDLDDALLDRGLPVVRYADDFVVLGVSRDTVLEAARVATDALEGIGMSLGEDKTEVMNFDDGFCFLGEDFGSRYPPSTDSHRVEVPTRRILYCGRQGSRVFTKNGRVVVESKDNTTLADVPKNLVSRIVCFGAVSLAAGTRSWTLDEGTDVVFLSRRGNYQGQQLAAADGSRVARLCAQLKFVSDPALTLPVARRIVDAKISHQITLLQRFTRPEDAESVESALRTAREMRRMLVDASTVDEVFGLEGAAAGAYFKAYGQLLPDDLAFTVRSRRPPMDVANSALGYGYAILVSECVSALVAAGLDPNIGVLHKASGRRPGLALDLMEEFRPLIIDQVVLTAARQFALTAEHGSAITGERGIYLTKAGKSSLVRAYERRMLQVTAGAIPGFRGSWRRHLYRQANLLMRTIMNPDEQWTGLSWR